MADKTTLASKGEMTPCTQKVTSSLSVGSGIDENRVRIDGCRIWFYLYDRCRAPAMLKRLSGSIVLARSSCRDNQMDGGTGTVRASYLSGLTRRLKPD